MHVFLFLQGGGGHINEGFEAQDSAISTPGAYSDSVFSRNSQIVEFVEEENDVTSSESQSEDPEVFETQVDDHDIGTSRV